MIDQTEYVARLRQERDELKQRIEALESEIRHMREARTPVFVSGLPHKCDCPRPTIKCDATGCRCVHCGGIEG